MTRPVITPEDLIIELMPFSVSLKKFCEVHPEFKNALKFIYFNRFIALQAIFTSSSPYYSKDQVIGIPVYDYGLKKPLFKQDFIINRDGTNTEFVLYTGLSSAVDNKYVKHVNEFLAFYGRGKYYINAHRPRYEDFPPELKERAKKAIELAEERKRGGYVEVTPEFSELIYKKLKKLKKI